MPINPKYNIRRRLLQLPGKYLQNKYRLCIAVECAERTFDNWADREKGEQFSIPSDQLIKLSEFFNCTIFDLIN